MCPSGSGEIQTSVQPGGMTSAATRRRASALVISAPNGSWYLKPPPTRSRVMPGPCGSLRVSPGTAAAGDDARALIGSHLTQRHHPQLLPSDRRAGRAIKPARSVSDFFFNLTGRVFPLLSRPEPVPQRAPPPPGPPPRAPALRPPLAPPPPPS